jgi:hypothetical protein
MPNPTMPDHTRFRFRPAECFYQDDDRRDHAGVCFHPGDDRGDHSGGCFHPGDDRGDHSGGCFHPGDDGRGHSGGCFHPGDDQRGDVRICFHPDDGPVAIGTGSPVSPCHHPSEPGDHTGRSEDLAAGLHRTLTEFEQQHLAALSSRS